MLGDRIIISKLYKKLIDKLYNIILDKNIDPISVSISGESGSGKSCVSCSLLSKFSKNNIEIVLLSQDDYFKYPPKINHIRRKNLKWVGPREVNLALLQEHINLLKSNKNQSIVKPLVDFSNNIITSETIPIKPYKVILIDGTYINKLNNIDIKIFLDKDYTKTKKHRLMRARERSSDFIEEILKIEHAIITKLKRKSNIIIKL